MASNDDEARRWEAQRDLLQAMHKSIIVKDEGRGLSEFERNLVEGFGALVGGAIDESYSRLEMMVREILDPYVFAVMDVDEKRGAYRYIYSSRPDEFPVTDDRPLPDGPWTESVVEGRQMMYSNYLTAIAMELPDRAESLALGCQCFGYVPISGGKGDKELMGVLLLLAKKDFFSEENIRALTDKVTHISIYMGALNLARKHESPDS